MKDVSLLFLLLLSTINADNCPQGYAQAPNGGDCYQLRKYFDSFNGQYRAKHYYEVEVDCNNANGGLLASIHSEEEHDFIISLKNGFDCGEGGSYWWANIGLRCVGLECKWDDGSPVTYTNFEEGKEPIDDGRTRCYGVHGKSPIRWASHSCDDAYTGYCWACSVKAKSFECEAGETEYKGGCLSVHTTPLDQRTAEASCPGEGHLVSTHGGNENLFFAQMAGYGGVNGTIYIGGEYSNGVFEWIDGSIYNQYFWAVGFPNTIFGTCVQMLLSSEFGVAGQWTNIDCTVKQPYMCFRNGGVYGPTAFPPPPKADAHCPPIQYYTGVASIYSPNYPLSIPSQQKCEYVMGAKDGTRASVKFPVFNCQSGTSLELYDGLNSDKPFLAFTTTRPTVNQSYIATTNVMKMVFSANGPSAPVGTGWEAEFNGV